MAELLESPGNFYLNAETYNNTDGLMNAAIQISDRDDILSRQDKWMVHVTRFAIDTQASLYYIEPDSTAVVTLTVIEYHDVAQHRADTARHFVDQRSVTMTNGASTLADFLEQLNEGVPILDHNNYRDTAGHAGGREPARAGRWSVSPSGAFKFVAKLFDKAGIGQGTTVPVYAPRTEEYFVNIKCSESMRRILGFESATSRVQGNQSSLRRWKSTITNFMGLLPAYRKDIKNWRWAGNRRHHGTNNWNSEMYYILYSTILRGVPLNGVGTVDLSGGHPQRGDWARAPGFVSGINFWRNNDHIISNYVTPSGRGAAGGYADSTHEYTQFAKLQTIVTARAQGVSVDTLTLRSLAGVTNALSMPQPDMRWDARINIDGSQFGGFGDWIANNEGRCPFFFNAKQLWGSWTRAFIMNVPNRRQLHLNKGVLTGGNANIADGGALAGPPPAVGDTIYIPGSANYDGSAVMAGDFMSDYNRMQRGIITAVSSSTVVRAPAIPAEDTWLVTFDTELESNGARFANLSPRTAANGNGRPATDVGDPQARVIYGTRRIPFSPMVYMGEVDVLVNAAADEFTFRSIKEFPVSVGDAVYIGHEPNDSTQTHIVTDVDYHTGYVKIPAHGRATIPANTILIGFARDLVYDVMFAADEVGYAITSGSVFMQGGHRNSTTDVNQATVNARTIALTDLLENSKSASYMRVAADSTHGMRNLTEAEADAPGVSTIDTTTGVCTITAPVLRAGGNSGQNNIIASDFQAHIGAAAQYTLAQVPSHAENNINACPSSYFQIDVPEETGIYAQPLMNSFMRAHFREDWFIRIVALGQHTQGVEGGRVTLNDPTDQTAVLAQDMDNDGNGTIPWDCGHVVRTQRDNDGHEYMYKLCGIATLPAYQVGGGAADKTNEKYVCYTFDRSQFPGGHNHDVTTQWFHAINNDPGVRFPIFGTLKITSGWNGSDGVQSIFKGNKTLVLKDNALGINLALRTNDYFISARSGQVDIAFPYKSISLTSNDLLAIPERTGDANSLQPVLSSYNIPTMFDAGASVDGTIESFTSSPYATVTFSEGGARRYHQLSPIPGGLRQFTVQCVLDPKDDKVAKTSVKLPPGGRFSCQFLFVRKV